MEQYAVSPTIVKHHLSTGVSIDFDGRWHWLTRMALAMIGRDLGKGDMDPFLAQA